MKQILVKTGKWMLIVLFLSYYLSATSFYHAHYYSWGVVSHSHFTFPFGDNPAQHNHSQIQCQTIQFLSYIALAFLITAFIFKLMKIRRTEIFVRKYKTHFYHITSPLRAPPIC